MVDFTLGEARTQAPHQNAPFHEWALPDGTLWMQIYRAASGYLLRFPELADFEVSRNGNTVRGWPVPGVPEPSLQHLYLNQVLPLALSMQDKLVFHASAVEIGGAAVAFMGESGRGKSTLVASFATSGLRFLTDDGLVVENIAGEWCILPSHPSIRLWEDSQQALIVAGAPVASPVSYTSKSRFLAGGNIAFCDQPRRLRCVYFLGTGVASGLQFERLQAGEALIELVKHSFLLDIEERELLAAHFDELSRLTSLPLFYR
ncbi:MAG TPA: hypothetical protein DIC36_05610, partial [Gammaproteobacteria bacterium]|nr:hypothetical protein [Gammaproteobacteria bacterium]